MNPIVAIARLIQSVFSSVGYGFAYLTGGVESWRQKNLGVNTYVIDERFRRIKGKKLRNTEDLLKSIAELEIAKGDLENEIRQEQVALNDADENLRGAAAMAKQRRIDLGSKEAAEADPEYMGHVANYENLSETRVALKVRLDGDGTAVNPGLRHELAQLNVDIEGYDRQLKEMTKDARDLDRRKSAIVAELRTSAAKDRASRRIAGISQEPEDQELAEMERMGMEARARSRVAGRLAGSTPESQNSTYKQAARRSTSRDALEKMMGLAETEKPESPSQPVRLPEN